MSDRPHNRQRSPTSLGDIASWPVGSAAAVVIEAEETVDRVGDTAQVFALASITKVLAATSVLVAAEEESVHLDDDVAGAPEGAKLRDLLDHSSGLAPDEPRSISPVGERRIYSNMGYELAARHVESRTGIAFATYLHEAVCQPAGMSNTRLHGSPAHGASSTVDDLAAFIVALTTHRILSPAGVELLTSPSRPTIPGVLPGYGRQDPNPWGLGAEVRARKTPHWTAPEQGETTWGHFGRSGTFLWVDPDRKLAAICLTDTDFGAWAIERWPALNSAIFSYR